MELNQMQQFQAQFATFGDRLSKIEGKQDKMYFALMGNELSQDGGLIQRIKDLEEENAGLRDDLETLQKKQDKSDWHLYWLFGTLGALALMIGNYVVKILTKTP